MDCCHTEHTDHHHDSWKISPLLWGSGSIITASFIIVGLNYFKVLTAELPQWLNYFSLFVTEQMADMWSGLVIGIISIGFLAKVPKEIVGRLLGKGGTFSGILRAVLAGTVLDLCSHGILLVGSQLYKKGASLGQVMAFLIASPWNSLSLTLVLWALIGFKWMITFLILSLVIGLISGLTIDWLVSRKVLAENPVKEDAESNLPLSELWKTAWSGGKRQTLLEIIVHGIRDSLAIVQWLFIGVIIASVLRLFLSPEQFAHWFGSSLLGFGITMVSATVIEVCSEGAVPIAADILNRAAAPGNAFAFLMAGVATDYTEIMVLKETTGRWKSALFLPLVTLPLVILIAWILNTI